MTSLLDKILNVLSLGTFGRMRRAEQFYRLPRIGRTERGYAHGD